LLDSAEFEQLAISKLHDKIACLTWTKFICFTCENSAEIEKEYCRSSLAPC